MTGIILGSFLFVTGCSDEEEITAPETACSIAVYSPQVNDVVRSMPTKYGSEDLINIRWEGPRGGFVKIDLYCGSELVQNIAHEAENDGFYFWYAAPADLPTDSDYHIRVSSLSSEGCEDYGPAFRVVKPEECVLEALTTWPGCPSASLNQNSQMEIAWNSDGGSSDVEIQAWHTHFVLGRHFVGNIATLPNTASPYTWNVGEFGLEATGNQDRYYIQVVDHEFDTCTRIGSYFEYYLR